jgi:SAM-dependent methyltransferase
MPLATKYCKGTGVEWGAAAHNPFGLAGSINVAPFSDDPNDPNRKDFEQYKKGQVELCGCYAEVDIAAEATAVPLPDQSQDYVISSHVVEHLPNLIGGFVEANRLLRPGGIFFIIFPKRDALPSDVGRPITPLSHFIEDFETHATVDNHKPWDAQETPARAHYHVFTLQSMIELVEYCISAGILDWKIVAKEETDSKVGNGHTLVCQKAGGTAPRPKWKFW